MPLGSIEESVSHLEAEVHGEATGSRTVAAKEMVTEIVERVRWSVREELLAIARETPRFGSTSDRSELLDCVRQSVREEISIALSNRPPCSEGVGLTETATLPGMIPHSYVRASTAQSQSSKIEAVVRNVSRGTISLPEDACSQHVRQMSSNDVFKEAITLPQDESMQNVGQNCGIEDSIVLDSISTKYARGYLADSVLAKQHSDDMQLSQHIRLEVLSLRSRFWHHSRSKAAKLVKSRLFNVGASFFVILSAGLIGAQVDYMAKHIDATDRPPWPYVVADVFFLVIFAVEILLRIAAHGLQLYRMQGWQWYVFDTLLVVLQLLETFLSFVQFVHFAILRVARIIRLFRIVRVVRVLHLVRELRTIVRSIGKALRPFFGAFLLLMLLIYIVGVYILQIVLDHYIGNSEAFHADPNLQKYWPSLGIVMLSLFQSLFGGVDWENVLDPLLHSISPWMALLFMTFIAFATFVVMNLITGIFFDLTLTTLNEIKDHELIKQMTDLFLAADDDQSGFICYPDFEQQLQNPLLEKYFREIDIHLSEAKGLFNLLDTDNTGRVDAQDFVMGCLRLRGNARALEMANMASHMHQSFLSVKVDLAGILEVLVEIADLLNTNEGSSRQRLRYSVPVPARRTRASLLLPGGSGFSLGSNKNKSSRDT